MTDNRAKKHFAIPPALLLLGYVLIALLPVVLAFVQDLKPRPFPDELSSALAMIGFAMLLLEFIISGRFKTVSGRVGIDISMGFHRLMAYTLTVLLLVHPWLFTLPFASYVPPDPSAANALQLQGSAVGTGWAAWYLLLLLVIWARFRKYFGYRYEVWRVGHGICALGVVAFGLHHTLQIGRYSADGAMTVFWFALASIAVLTLLHVYLVRPLLERGHAYHVAAVEPVAHKIWQITVEPDDGPALPFQAGQFAWLTVDRSPFSKVEHPFSMSSCPAQRPSIMFTIKAVGDFTSTIDAVRIGAPAYIDGPHGNMVIEGRPGAGLVLIAGGVGFAPIMSILRQARADGEERPIKLIYGNRIEDQILFAQELHQMRTELDLEIIHVLSQPPAAWTGMVGQLDGPMLERCLDMADRGKWLYVVCGPTAMIDDVEKNLARLDVPLQQIVSERFSYD